MGLFEQHVMGEEDKNNAEMTICQLWPCPLLGMLRTVRIASVQHVSIEAEKEVFSFFFSHEPPFAIG